MEDTKIRELRKELQEKINSCDYCWCCGRRVHLTRHHAIPQRINNVVMNITIPVCDNCTELIHKYDELVGILKKMFLK